MKGITHGVHRGKAGRIHLDQTGGNGLIGGSRGDDSFGRQDSLPLWQNAATDQLLDTERHFAFGSDHEKVLHIRRGALGLDDRRQTLVVVARTTVADLAFHVAAIMQRSDFALDMHPLAVKPVGLATYHGIKRLPHTTAHCNMHRLRIG